MSLSYEITKVVVPAAAGALVTWGIVALMRNADRKASSGGKSTGSEVGYGSGDSNSLRSCDDVSNSECGGDGGSSD